HKVYAPKGIGALVIRNTKFHPTLYGGGQERSRRAGTENVACAAAFARAIDLLESCEADVLERMRQLRDLYETEITKRLTDVEVVAQAVPRTVNTSSVVFRGVPAQTLLIN